MRRRMGRPLRRMLAPAIPPLLRRSNELLSAGNPTEAARGLEQLARAAEARGGRRAPTFYIHAGSALVLAGRPAEAVDLFERGLGLLAARGRSHKVSVVANRLLAELLDRGLTAESKHITDYLNNLAPGFGSDASDPLPQRKAPLPTHCPGCGAPVRPDEVEWLDDITAECAFCGSPVRAE